MLYHRLNIIFISSVFIYVFLNLFHYLIKAGAFYSDFLMSRFVSISITCFKAASL